jgi:hypothetical protein
MIHPPVWTTRNWVVAIEATAATANGEVTVEGLVWAFWKKDEGEIWRGQKIGREKEKKRERERVESKMPRRGVAKNKKRERGKR